MSPDLNLANALNAASAIRFPGSEPVEIFQAELFTILEKLASGATTLSAEDELEEMESLDDDSSANPRVPDETSSAAWVDVRPALVVLPEIRTALSLDFSGRLEAPVADQATPEQAIGLAHEISEEMLTQSPKTSEEQLIGGLREGEVTDEIVFEAEITQVRDNASSEESPAQKLVDPKTASRIEPVRQSHPEQRNSGGKHDKPHQMDAPATRIEFSSEPGIATARTEFQSIMRSEPAQDAAPSRSTPALVESAEPVQKTPGIAQQPLRDLSLGFVSDQTRVGIQVRESGGSLQVSVRTSDSGVSAALQQNLDELAATLSKQGLDTQFWTPAEDHRLETHASEQSGDSGHSSPDWQGRGNGGQDGGSQHRHNQRSRADWLNTFTSEKDAETKDDEVTSWPFNSQTFQTRR